MLLTFRIAVELRALGSLVTMVCEQSFCNAGRTRRVSGQNAFHYPHLSFLAGGWVCPIQGDGRRLKRADDLVSSWGAH